MTALPLPAAPPQTGVAPGWYRSTNRGEWAMLHRLTAGADGQPTSVTLCGRRMACPELVLDVGVLVGACAACERSAGSGRRSASLAGPAASPVRAAVVGDPVVALMLSPGHDLDGIRSDHVDDGTGHCRTCGGPQSGRLAWPCTTRRAADRAAELRDDGRGHVPSATDPAA